MWCECFHNKSTNILIILSKFQLDQAPNIYILSSYDYKPLQFQENYAYCSKITNFSYITFKWLQGKVGTISDRNTVTISQSTSNLRGQDINTQPYVINNKYIHHLKLFNQFHNQWLFSNEIYVIDNIAHYVIIVSMPVVVQVEAKSERCDANGWVAYFSISK